jgi:predicted DNA-binding transcriptional regulator YafY
VTPVLDTSARLLALLSLLQSRPRWTGPELAERLGVAARTVRTDIVRLRELGYTVESEPGRTGHYRLGVGAVLPPLLLDDEEAVAVTIGLRVGLAGIGNPDSGARALAKLERILPQHLRRTVAALHEATAQARENIDTDAEDPVVDPTVLARLGTAIRDRRAIRFALTGPDTEQDGPTRVAEPYRLVSWQRRWYLVVREAAAWGVLRVDWLDLRVPDGPLFTPQPEPDDLTGLVMRQVAAQGWLVRARIAVDAPAEAVLARIHAGVGVVEMTDDRRCVLVTGADSLATIAAYIGMLDMDFHVLEPAELVDHVRRLGERYARAR